MDASNGLKTYICLLSTFIVMVSNSDYLAGRFGKAIPYLSSIFYKQAFLFLILRKIRIVTVFQSKNWGNKNVLRCKNQFIKKIYLSPKILL